MSKREDQRGRAIDKLAAHVLETGLAQTSLRQLAQAAGVSDRMLLYYFKDKTEVLACVLVHIATQMAHHLDTALPGDAVLTPHELFTKTADLTLGKKFRPYMRLWVEAIAAAGRGEPLYTQLANEIAKGFLAWIEARLATRDKAKRKAEAAMILAMVDGLAILALCAKRSVVQGAVKEMAATLSGGE